MTLFLVKRMMGYFRKACANAVHLSFFNEAVHCSTLEPLTPAPLPKGERGALI